MIQILQRFFLLLSSIFLIYSASVAQDTTNRGREFWVGYGHHQFMETGTNTQNMILYLGTDNQPATVTVTLDSSGAFPLPWKKTYTIKADTIITSDIIPKGYTDASGSGTDPNYDARLYTDPPPAGNGSAGTFRKKGIHIESNVPIAVHAQIYGSASPGVSTLLPVQAWGYTYTCVNSKQSYASNCASWAYVIAKENNTVIEITPSVLTRSQNSTGLQPGVAKTITLHKGQIYQLLGANDGADANGNGGSATTGKELTGTLIRSLSAGKPIAVFAGSDRTSNPASCGSGGGDNDIAQLFPLQTWGKRYLTAPVSGSSSASSFATSIYKIIVKDPSTVVTRNGVVLSSLINSSYYTFESNAADYLQADKPIMVAQFMTGGGCLGAGGLGDADMFYLSPIDEGIKHVKCLRTTRQNITVNYVTLIIPSGGLSSLLIDSTSAFTYTYPHPALAGYTVVIKNWTAAQKQFTVQSDSAFTGITYGLGAVESYAYNIGAKFNPVNAVDPMVPIIMWTGETNGDWNTGSNWSSGNVPTSEDNVIVPSNTPFSPVVGSGVIVSCKSIKIYDGAVVTVGLNARLNVVGL